MLMVEWNLCRRPEMLSQLQPDQHLRQPLDATPADADVQSPVWQGVPFSLGGRRHSNRDNFHFNVQLAFPEMARRRDIRVVVDAEEVAEWHARHEAATPAKPDAQQGRVGISQSQPPPTRCLALVSLTPVETNAEEKEGIVPPLFPKRDGLGGPPLPSLLVFCRSASYPESPTFRRLFHGLTSSNSRRPRRKACRGIRE